MSRTIPETITVHREELLTAIANWRRMIDGAEKQIGIAEAEVRGLDRAITAYEEFLPSGEDDTEVVSTTLPFKRGKTSSRPHRSYPALALQVVQDAPGLTAEEITNTISARDMKVTHKPRIADALEKLRRDGKVRQAEDGTWWPPIEIPPAASSMVEADPGQAVLGKPLEVKETTRKGSRVSTPLKHTNPPKPEMSAAEAYDYLARSGEIGDDQIDLANARNGVSRLLVSGDAEMFLDEQHGDRRYRLRQTQPETPE